MLHSVNISIVVAVAYKYFRNDLCKAQLLSFLLIANEEARELNQMMFNDSLLSFYILLCLYFVAMNRPIPGALCLTLGLSIKAGAILLIPGFFGWV
jgi:predicted membrane-bound dolichyl-phosphate-mannose-protein mannosyltransferase